VQECPVTLVVILSSPIRHTVTMVRLYWRVINAGKQSDLCRNQKNVSVIETGLQDLMMTCLFCFALSCLFGLP